MSDQSQTTHCQLCDKEVHKEALDEAEEEGFGRICAECWEHVREE